MIMAELNKSNKQKIDVNTYRFESGRTIDEILKSDSRFWATDEQCLLNMIDSDWRYVEDFITEKEKELAKKFQAAANNPETDLKLLAVQSDAATQFLCQKHTNQELWEKAINDPNGRTRPYSKEVVNVENQINFPYELPSWIKNSIEEIPSNWFKRTPQQLQEEEEKEEIITAQAAVAAGLSYEEWEEMLNDNEIAEERIEQIQVNGGMNEAAIQADISASENKKADWIDSDGNPHWNDEEEIDEPVNMAGYEFDEYIHSDEFIEKFGDWEKANRLEKLKEAETIVKDGTIVIDNFDYTAQIDKYEKEQNLSQLKLIGGILGDEIKGTYNNIDVNSKSIKEIKRHDTKDAAHIKSIYYIPDFLTKGTFISKEKNEDIVTHRKITEYQYLISSLNINNIDYTVKSAIAVDDVGNKYYDHKLSKIEKGNLLASLSSVSSQGKYSDFLFPQLKDKRLLQICQVAQMPYLERNSVTNKWQPTDKAVELVKAGKLYQEIDPVSGFYSMCDETKTNPFVLDFRNAYNASKMNYESKLTYENAEALIVHTPLSNFSKSQLEIKDNYVVSKDSNGIMTPREFFDNVIYELKNNKALDFENINNYLPSDKESAELTSIKNIDDLNQYAKECKDIVLCSCRTCTNYKEKVDFDHVVSNTKNKFHNDFESNKNSSDLEKKRLKEKYEYFKKNAMELYKSASAEYSIELNKQQEKEEIITAQAAVAAGLSYEEWEEMLNDNEIAEERIEQINGGVSEATLNKTDLEHIKRDFSYIRDIFETGDSISVKNEMVGLISIDKGNIGKSGNGLQHICTQRFEKDGRSVDEITAMLALVVNSAENGTVSRNNEIYQNEKDIGTYDIEKNGIIAFVSKTRDGNDEKFVITGFDDNSKKIEASDAINAVIAENSYAPDFVIVKEQVVATLASSYMLHLNEIESNLLNPKKDNIKRINKELKLLENYKNSDEIKRYFKNNSEDFDKVKKSIKKIDDLTNTSSEYQDIKKRINDLAVINTNEEVLINKTALNTELEDAKKIIQEKDKELDIWTAKAEADNKEISRLNNQLEAANNTIQKLEKQNKEQDELLNGKGSVKVNGVERKFEHGLKQAFPEAVKRIDIENQRNKELTADYNKLLKSHNQNISPKSPGDDSSWSN